MCPFHGLTAQLFGTLAVKCVSTQVHDNDYRVTVERSTRPRRMFLFDDSPQFLALGEDETKY